ncbi:MAG: hypothetical protein NC111_05870 [Bacteroides sp.]|nr:hypothetical protein [Bacteroides sp.]MCM1414214.1 hypothetical protein [Bacteroides sp.]MCM1472036.1 hypothetical protein [Bacteroides sp.]
MMVIIITTLNMAYSMAIMSLAPKKVSFTFLYSINATKAQSEQSGIEDRCPLWGVR